MLRRLVPLLLLVAAAALAACGSQEVRYTVAGDRPPASGPPITPERFQAAIETRGVDLFQDRGAERESELDPRPVQALRYATADSGFFELYVFVDERAAQAAVASAKDGSIADDGQVVQEANIIVAIPDNGSTTMVKAVPGALKDLAAKARQDPSETGTTPLDDNAGDGESDQPQGPPA
jgi:hypothetical protein